MAVNEMQRSRNERIWGRSVADYRYFAWMVEELYAHGMLRNLYVIVLFKGFFFFFKKKKNLF